MTDRVKERLTVALPPALATAVRASAGDNISAWMERAARRELLHQSLNAYAAAGALDVDEDVLATTEADLEEELDRRDGGSRAA